MLSVTKGDRKIRAMMLNESVDRCRGVVQCALEGCQTYMAIVEPGTQRASGNIEDMTPNEHAWFLQHHECRGLGGAAPRKKKGHRR
jgi:hypothetical protein